MIRLLGRILMVSGIALSLLPPPAADAQVRSGAVTTRRTTKPKGGTYVILGRDGAVIRVGRSKNLAARMRTHRRQFPQYRVRIDRRTDDRNLQRGREQVLIRAYNPPLNKIAGVSRKNANRRDYLLAARTAPRPRQPSRSSLRRTTAEERAAALTSVSRRVPVRTSLPRTTK